MFALLGGDLTDNGSNLVEWEEFLDAATSVFSRIPVMPAKGNHDKELFVEFLPCRITVPRESAGRFTPLIMEKLISWFWTPAM